MLKTLLKNIVSLLPFGIEGRLRNFRIKQRRKLAIQQWVKNGRPIPPPHAVKQQVIEDFKNRFQYKTLVETGTYKGHMIYAQLHNFEEIYSVELDEGFYKAAQQKFKKFRHIHLFQGDSEKCLFEITAQLKNPAIFWLDGHYMGDDGVRGETDCPIWGELEAIFSGNKFPHVILIDDARSFKGSSDYPSVESINNWILTKNDNYKYVIENDIIQFFI